MGKTKLQYKPSIQTNRIAGETYYTSDDVAGRAFETRERLIEVYNQEKDGKDKFQPIVMPCNKEQYESLLPVLQQNNIKIIKKHTNNVIVNNYNGCNYEVAKVYDSLNAPFHKHYNRKVYKRFNRKIFLKSLGIIEESEFVLPNLWCVRITDTNYQEISKYRAKTHYYSLTVSRSGFLRFDGIIIPNNIQMQFKEITFEQFKKYVLKEEVFVLPEKWLVTYANFEEFDIINKHFKKGWYYNERDPNTQGYFSDIEKRANNWVSINDVPWSKKQLLKNGYTEITFEQFQKYVVNNTSNLESQSETNKQTKMKSRIQKKNPPAHVYQKGDLINFGNDVVAIATKTVNHNFNATVLFSTNQAFKPGDIIHTTQGSDKLSVFIGEVILEQ